MKNALLLLVLILAFNSCSKNKSTQGIKEFELAPGIFITDKDKPVKTLSELTGFFSDRPFYIDRWATWCSPCLEEFRYSDTIYRFLTSNKIELVYLNSDRELNDSIYYDFVVSHNLRGHHLRLNEQLKKDLSEKKIFIPLIPQYLIVDKTGKVLENNALRPSTGDSLKQQIKKLLLL
jgi:thiol-disulfide isomerase/thioredoxin